MIVRPIQTWFDPLRENSAFKNRSFPAVVELGDDLAASPWLALKHLDDNFCLFGRGTNVLLPTVDVAILQSDEDRTMVRYE